MRDMLHLLDRSARPRHGGCRAMAAAIAVAATVLRPPTRPRQTNSEIYFGQKCPTAERELHMPWLHIHVEFEIQEYGEQFLIFFHDY